MLGELLAHVLARAVLDVLEPRPRTHLAGRPAFAAGLPRAGSTRSLLPQPMIPGNTAEPTSLCAIEVRWTVRRACQLHCAVRRVFSFDVDLLCMRRKTLSAWCPPRRGSSTELKSQRLPSLWSRSGGGPQTSQVLVNCTISSHPCTHSPTAHMRPRRRLATSTVRRRMGRDAV